MKQILIVEDDSFLNKMLVYNLTADGYLKRQAPDPIPDGIQNAEPVP